MCVCVCVCVSSHLRKEEKKKKKKKNQPQYFKYCQNISAFKLVEIRGYTVYKCKEPVL